MNTRFVECGYFVTYVSTSWKKEVSKAFMKDQGMMIHIDEEYRNDKWSVYCCDVSWISKFPDECEILFARSLPTNINFKCVILDEENGIQTISLGFQNGIKKGTKKNNPTKRKRSTNGEEEEPSKKKQKQK